MLEDDHRVGVLERRQQQPLGVGGRRGLHHLEAGDVAEPGLEALAVLGGGAGAGARRHPHHQRHRGLAAEHVAQLRRLVDDLLHRERGEVGELELEDRAQAGQRRADRDAGAAELGDRRVHHPVRAEAVDEIAGHLEGAAVDADVLAHQDHPLVALEGDPHRVADRLGVAHLAGGEALVLGGHRSAPGVDVAGDLGGRGRRARLGELDAGGDLGLGLLQQRRRRLPR